METQVSETTQPKFLTLNNETEVVDHIKNSPVVILIKPVQSGKTSDVFKIVEHTYKESVTIFVSDKNVALASQTNSRAKVQGWTITNFGEIPQAKQSAFAKNISKGFGKKQIFHFLMEHNNLDSLYNACIICQKPITLIIDEADKNRNVGEYDSSEEDDDNPADTLPVITRELFAIKNFLKQRNNGSKIIFVTATAQSLMVSEYDADRLVIYKEPYKNYVGAGFNHIPNVDIASVIRPNNTPAIERWTGSLRDQLYNTFRQGVALGVEEFANMRTKDETVKQVMLISLESRNANQNRMASHIVNEVFTEAEREEIDVIVFNGTNKTFKGWMLSEIINYSSKRKVIVIAGFMASRGVSFTDFSNPDGKFELCIQIHNTKQIDPLNSAAQAMRVFGPARRTITRPMVICNDVCRLDLRFNFVESYRVVRDLAMGLDQIERGDYDTSRPLTQKYNFRYMVQATGGGLLLFKSGDPEDWKPISTTGEGV